ncbi:hypothetical protein [Fulvivirga sedimenti]|uniref:Uncharacterized protein n=1 Tax=Fulvivirga sedimenti TaxID=2879465 RepID=A0A9X1HWG9_9BACT|nr:hypothetical protein [Fulvivirga sedimenti]MCA6079116.1 hypothetical protein [Fulvivirga sedimenti]
MSKKNPTSTKSFNPFSPYSNGDSKGGSTSVSKGNTSTSGNTNDSDYRSKEPSGDQYSAPGKSGGNSTVTTEKQDSHGRNTSGNDSFKESYNTGTISEDYDKYDRSEPTERESTGNSKSGDDHAPQGNNSNNQSSGKQPEADMTFTEEEVYGDTSSRDEIFDSEDSTERDSSSENQATGYGSITESQLQEVRRRVHIPADGFLVTTARGRIRRNIEVERINQLLSRISEGGVRDHILQTIRLFTEDNEERSHLNRNQIDLPFTLAVAIRESGVSTVISDSTSRIVTAGRDAHTEGRSGLDWVYDYKRYFPSSIRNQVQQVRGNTAVGGSFRREVNPAYLRQSDLLAAFIVEIRMRYQRFLRRFHRHEFARDFNEEQRNILLENMTKDTRRAWIQASFGSRLVDLLVAVRSNMLQEIRSGRSFQEVAADNMLNLNSLISNDEIMPENLSRQRTRISAAEASLVEMNLPEF